MLDIRLTCVILMPTMIKPAPFYRRIRRRRTDYQFGEIVIG